MKEAIAFSKKEWMEQLRSGKLVTLLIVFVFFGILAPALAKLLPWIVQLNAQQLAESGLIIKEVRVTALEAWTQFYKNMPIVLFIFLLVQSSIFTKEYQMHTLVLAITKGLHRSTVVLTKASVLLSLWTVGYWLSAGITYAYSIYFWDPSILEHLGFSLLSWWIFGMMVIALMILFSTVVTTNTNVLVLTGIILGLFYVLSFIEKINVYLPIQLTAGVSIITNVLKPEDCFISIIITIGIFVLSLIMSLVCMRKQSL